MTEPPTGPSDRAWVGRVVFPRTAADLRATTQCPACLTPLTSLTCGSCGLDLRHPASAELATASEQIADALDARLDIIGRMRRESAAILVEAMSPQAGSSAQPAGSPPAQAPSWAPVAPVAVSAPAGPAASVDPGAPAASVAPAAPTGPAAGTRTAGVHAPPTEARPGAATDEQPSRRSGVQIALIVVGVSLLSVFAAFGLVYAFVTYGSPVRLTIIGAGTLATLVAATVLARRGLVATAEGIGALGTIMLLLDAWALRLNDPSGLGATPLDSFWGVALLIVATTAVLWSRASKLSVPAVVAAILVPIGVALLTSALVEPSGLAWATTASAIAAIVAGSVSWLVIAAEQPRARRVGRIVGQIVAGVAVPVGLVAMVFVDPSSRFAPLVGGFAVAAAALTHIGASHLGAPRVTTPSTTGTAARAAGGTAVFAIAGAVFSLSLMVGVIAAAARFDQDRVIVSAPLIAAALIAVVTEQAWHRAGRGSGERLAAASATATAAGFAALAGGLAGVVGLSAFVQAATLRSQAIPSTITGQVASTEPATIAALGALALALGLISLGWALIGRLTRRARAVTPIAAGLIVAVVPLLGDWWLVMSLYAALAVGSALALHGAVRVARGDARLALATLWASLCVGSALGAFLVAWAVPAAWSVGVLVVVLTVAIARTATRLLPLRAATLGATAALVLVSVPAAAVDVGHVGFTASESAIVVFVAAVMLASAQLGRLSPLERMTVSAVSITAAAVALTAAGVVGDDASAQLAIALALFAGALVIVALRRSGGEHLTSRLVLPPTLAVAAALGGDAFGLGEPLRATLALSALVVVAAAGAVAAGAHRVPADGVTLIVGAIVVAPLVDGQAGWLLVLILSVLVLVVSVSRDGIVGAASARRHVAWGSLVLATAALWMRLADSRVLEPEGYVLPPAGILLLIAAASALVARRRDQPVGRGVALITAAALLLALLPLALTSDGYGDGLWRAIVVTAVGASLALLSALRAQKLDHRLPGMVTTLVAVGAASLVVLAATQTADLVGERFTGTLAVPSAVRAVSVIALLGAIAVAVWVLHSGRRRAGATAALAGTTALTAAALSLSGALDPVELASLPLAITLLTIGGLRLAAHPPARSWPWLGPGFVALLVPSLLGIDGAGEPLWRAVALGIAAASVFTLALLARLQAPFVIAGAVLLVHLLVQSWPLLTVVGESVEWWLWLGFAGVLIVALAARYERRLQNVRGIAVRIAQLR